MKQSNSSKYSRNRGGKSNRRSSGNSINRVYDSAGPEGKVRGTPQQVVEKYLTLSRDAATAGDRIGSENFAQHAEHYQRILLEAQSQHEARHQERQKQQQQQANGHAGSERANEKGKSNGTDNSGGSSDSTLTTIDTAAAQDFAPIVTPEDSKAAERKDAADAKGAEAAGDEVKPSKRRSSKKPAAKASEDAGATQSPAAEAAEG